MFLLIMIFGGMCSYFNDPVSRLMLKSWGLDQVCEVWDKSSIGSYTNSRIGTPVSPESPAGVCSPLTSGPASLQSLESTCLAPGAVTASMIAKLESGGNPLIPSSVDICLDENNQPRKFDGENVSVSWGLFQINLTAHKIGALDCPKAFDRLYTAQNHYCRVVNPDLFRQCKSAAKEPSTHIQAVCAISKNGTDWTAWAGDRKKCNF